MGQITHGGLAELGYLVLNVCAKGAFVLGVEKIRVQTRKPFCPPSLVGSAPQSAPASLNLPSICPRCPSICPFFQPLRPLIRPRNHTETD